MSSAPTPTIAQGPGKRAAWCVMTLRMRCARSAASVRAASRRQRAASMTSKPESCPSGTENTLPGCSTSALGGLKRQPARERGAARARRVGIEPQKAATSALLSVGGLIRSQRRRRPQACLRARLPVGTRVKSTRGRQPRTAGARQPAAQRSAAASACCSLPPPSRAPHTLRARRAPQTSTQSRSAARNRGCGASASAASTARFICPTRRRWWLQRRRLPQMQERCTHAPCYVDERRGPAGRAAACRAVQHPAQKRANGCRSFALRSRAVLTLRFAAQTRRTAPS
jgi:hypothetical protein